MLTINDYETIFHEMKNVLSVVSCSLQLIEKQHPEVKEYHFWKDTESDLLGLRTLLTDIAITRLCNSPQKRMVNIDTFLQDLKTACPKANYSEHPLIIEVEVGLTEGFFDSVRIQHALLRILDNAFDAIYPEGFVELHAFSRDNGIVFEISDNGKGIPPEALPLICTPFYGAGDGKNGLGLFISKEIVDSHNGTLTIDSEPQKGTTVSIFLPCTAA